jgi:DNA-binding winged helix-turn-helix (wHTH) protein
MREPHHPADPRASRFVSMPLPSDRLQVGECVVDVARREVLRAEDEMVRRITVKSLHVLLALVEQHDRVVSREALLDRVWPETMPTDDVLTQAVTQLRKAFGDGHEAPRYIETIAKAGYRLLAPVAWLEPAPPSPIGQMAPSVPITSAEPAAAAAPAVSVAEPEPAPHVAVPAPAPAPPTRRRIWLIAASVLGVCALVAAYLTRENEPAPQRTGTQIASPAAPALNFSVLTSRPGQEWMPSLSPDATQVAYVEADAQGGATTVMVQTTAQVSPRRLTQPPEGSSDVMPVWSPDGRELAFVRLGPDKGCQIMLVAASGGAERRAGACYGGSYSWFDWTPDGEGLVMGGLKLAGETRAPLRVLELADGRWRALRYPIRDGDIDINPHYSPDGRSLGFRRNVSLSDLWLMPAAGGPLQRLTDLRTDIRGWDWLPDGSGLVLSDVGMGGMLRRLDLRSGRLTELDVPPPMLMPDLAARAPALVFEISRSRNGLFRADPGGQTRARPAAQLFASSGDDLLPAISPDGSTLAFYSDRSAHNALWIGRLDAPASLRPIEGLEPVLRHAPVWSPDGRRLLVFGMEGPRRLLAEVEADTGAVHILPVPVRDPVYAAYTNAPGRLLVGADGGAGRLDLMLFDTLRTPWGVLASIDDVTQARFDFAAHQVVFTRSAQPGLFRADAQLNGIAPLPLRSPIPIDYRNWAIGRQGIYAAGPHGECPVALVRLSAGGDEPPRCIDRDLDERLMAMPSVGGPDDGVYLTLPVSITSDIGWIELDADAPR